MRRSTWSRSCAPLTTAQRAFGPGTSWVPVPRTARRAGSAGGLILRAAVAWVLMLGVGACAMDAADESTGTEAPAVPAGPATAVPAPAASGTAAAAPQGTATVTTGNADPYGAVLTDGTGMTLYVFFEDSEGRSMCYDACADNWPPLLTGGDPGAEGAADGGLLGTLRRDNGARQVTYDGQPLYRYAGDSEPGDARGSGIGNVWYPVTPAGAPIDAAAGGSEPTGGGY